LNLFLWVKTKSPLLTSLIFFFPLFVITSAYGRKQPSARPLIPRRFQCLVNFCKQFYQLQAVLSVESVACASNLRNIQPIELLSRKNCKTIHGKLKKVIKPEWIANYNRVLVIDDSPNVWMNDSDKIDFLVPDEFRGDANDLGLHTIINKLNRY
jgi:hypothetical protein